ncbi:MAG: asparagine synthase (glutamine-hydrolyzing) [Elusimicrobia bacterium]|nr:asparagine synthase (glutamine-hydrolyzing) [Elusimicrobiota bacterium]
MCGITGAVFTSPGRVDRARLERANELLRHRGPDDGGSFADERAGLAMRRLSIIDVAGGHQPIESRDGSLVIVFNGEIYNFPALRAELEAQGYPFKTHTDTEVVLALYETLGAKCLEKLRGMFAFAVWDKRSKRLFVARDRIGKKPLVYALVPGGLVFASELRSLFAWEGVDAAVDAKAVDLFLSLQYIPSPRTVYKGAKKLPPAHSLTWEDGRVTVERYWDLPMGAPRLTRDPEEAAELLREKLKEAVKIRLISEVPLGAFLSGGIDSSVVVACMAELSDKPVKTFSIGFDHEAYSELPYARQVAEAYGTQHTEFVVTAEMADVLPKLAWHYGEPYADASALPSYYVSRETRKHVTVALNGDGGDEDFGGYVRYFAMKAARLYDAVPSPLRRLAMAGAEFLPEKDAPFSTLWKAKRFLRSGVFTDLPQRHLKMICYFSDEDKKGLYAPGMLAAMGEKRQGDRSDAARYLAQAYDKAASEDFVNRMLYTDVVTYLPECLMAKMDIASMANSLEARSPFLDHELVELAWRLPGEMKLRGLKGHKWILKRAFADKLPQSIQKRPKMGFGIPLGPWFRDKLKRYWEETVLSPEALARGYFNEAALRTMWDQHQSRKRDHGYRLWALLMLELWHRQCLPDFKGFA